MTDAYSHPIIRSTAKEPHDAVFDPMFGPLDRIMTGGETLIAHLQPIQTSKQPVPKKLLDNCQHFIRHMAMHVISRHRYTFEAEEEKTLMLEHLSRDAYITMNSLDELRIALDEVPIAHAEAIQQASETIQRLKLDLRGLAHHAERSKLGIASGDTSPHR